MKTITISVTEADIADAENAKHRPYHGHIYHAFGDCPLTRAIQRVIPDIRGVGHYGKGYGAYYGYSSRQSGGNPDRHWHKWTPTQAAPQFENWRLREDGSSRNKRHAEASR